MRNFKILGLFILVASIVFLTDSCKEKDTTQPVVKNEDSTSYETAIKPIIMTSCAPCHSGQGYQTNYAIYDNSKNNIDLIITRVNLDESHSEFMPKDKTKLSQTDLDLLEKWKNSGLSK